MTSDAQGTSGTPAAIPARSATPPAVPRALLARIPIAGGMVALALAVLGEALNESGSGGILPPVCYLTAIAIFALTAVPDRLQRGMSSSLWLLEAARAGRRRWLLLGGAVLAIALNALAVDLVYRSLVDPQAANSIGPVLWFASLTVLAATAVLATPRTQSPGAWETGRLPTSPRLRWSLLAAFAALVLIAAAARTIGLADVPHGINADEGDRTATAISILRRFNQSSIFASGWYYISNFYFWLLAGVLKVLGVGYAQARAFGAVSSAITFCVIVWIGFRHFGARVALLAGILGAVLAVSLQFARETTEATETALLWTISVAFLLEAARRSRPWHWVGAGMSGALSLYFYPSGRLWAALAAASCGYLFLWTRGQRRWDVVVGTACMGLAAIMTVGPFFANIATNFDQWGLRAQQTSVLSNDNAVRLDYYNPHWSTAQLLWAQIERSLGIFSLVGDGGGFWPTDRPIMWGLLTVLTLLGLGWASLSWRDPRRFTLALWFWIGFAGVIVTVETPNVQRMATAVPVLPLLAAIVLDSLIRRVARLGAAWRQIRVPMVPAATALAVLVAAVLAWQQERFYFVTYAAMDRWPQPTIQGQAVADQGRNALVMTLGREWHQVNSGWVRLMAPNADRGGMPSAGFTLPLALPADRDLAFVLYPTQLFYLPYLESLYPGGHVHPYRHPSEGLVVTVYRVPRAAWAARQGAIARPAGGQAAHAGGLGVAPPGLTGQETLEWTAGLRVPQYWNYDLKVGAGPAQLTVDGTTVLRVPAGHVAESVTVSLARGEHFVRLDGPALPGVPAPLLQWRAQPGSPGPVSSSSWQTIPTAYLTAATAGPHGLFGEVTGAEVAPEQRLDEALSTCCLSNDLGAGGRPYTVTWRGRLRAPADGTYPMWLFTQGLATLKIDGRTVIRSSSPLADAVTQGQAQLSAGEHTVELVYVVQNSDGGLEWAWRPPGGREELVPPAALRPPAGAGVGQPVSLSTLNTPNAQPVDQPLVVVQ